MDEQSPRGNKWTYDTENRKNIPKHLKIPKIRKLEYNSSRLSEFVDYVNTNFEFNPGNTDCFQYPIDHEQAMDNFEYFLEFKFDPML